MLAADSHLGNYKILRPLGSGGMADVYEAEDQKLGRRVALKVLPPEFGRNPQLVTRFEKEVRAAAALNHHGIVTVFEVGQDQGVHYFSMRLLTGGDLRSRIDKGLTALEALAILREVADAFGHAHSRGFVHRDVKPENIIFDEAGYPVLTDFGIAKALDAGTRVTATGVSIGTPRYISPEQARGKAVDARADLYSLGVILFEMLTGKPPYDGDEALAVIFKHVTEPIPKLPEPHLPMQPMIDQLMAKEPDKRPASAKELIKLLDAHLPRAATQEQPVVTSQENPLIQRFVTPRTGNQTLDSGVREHAKQLADEEARQKEDAKRRQQEAEAETSRRKAEEEAAARVKAEAEAKRNAEAEAEAARRAAAEQKQQEELRRKEEERLRKEQEQQRKEEERRRKDALEREKAAAAAKLKAEAAERKRVEKEERQRKQREEEAHKRAEKEERRRKEAEARAQKAAMPSPARRNPSRTATVGLWVLAASAVAFVGYREFASPPVAPQAPVDEAQKLKEQAEEAARRDARERAVEEAKQRVEEEADRRKNEEDAAADRVEDQFDERMRAEQEAARLKAEQEAAALKAAEALRQKTLREEAQRQAAQAARLRAQREASAKKAQEDAARRAQEQPAAQQRAREAQAVAPTPSAQPSQQTAAPTATPPPQPAASTTQREPDAEEARRRKERAKRPTGF